MDAGLIGAVINVGFAAVVGWYLLTISLPNMQKEHNEASDKARADFLASLKEHRDAFNNEIKEQRATFNTETKEQRNHAEARELRGLGEAKTSLAQVIAHCEREATRRDEMMRAEMSVINNTLHNLMEAIEEWRVERRAEKEANG